MAREEEVADNDPGEGFAADNDDAWVGAADFDVGPEDAFPRYQLQVMLRDDAVLP